jgi:hypothetical protein
MRRSTPAVFCALALTLPACGGDDDDTASGETCEDLADDGIAVIQDALTEAEDLDLEALAAADGEPPEFIAEMEGRIEELDARQEELGCTDEEMDELMCDRVGDLDAEGVMAEMLSSELAGECGRRRPPARVRRWPWSDRPARVVVERRARVGTEPAPR